MLPADGDLTAEQIESVRARLAAYIDESGQSLESIQGKMDAKPGSVVRFFRGDTPHKHDPTIEKTALRIDRWLIQQTDAGCTGLPMKMIKTGTVVRMIGVIKATNERRSMSAIVGPSGLGKTVVLKATRQYIVPGSILIELTMTDSALVNFLRVLAGEVCGKSYGHGQKLMRNIINTLKGTDRMIMIDEVHYLSKQSLNALRDIHKQTGCPIVMMGTQDLLETINDFNQFHGQFKRLVTMTYNITDEVINGGGSLFTLEEVFALAKEMNLKLTGGGAELLLDLCNTLGWGGFGSAGHLLLNAELLRVSHNAKGKVNNTHISDKHLRSALKQMEGSSGFDRTITKMKSEQRRQVAV